MPLIVRSSKFRHVFGKKVKPELEYQDLQPSLNTWDTNKLTSNGKFIGVVWEARGGGSFAVIPYERTGKLPHNLPVINGHSSCVLDLEFHPFKADVIASSSEDCTAKLWRVSQNNLDTSADCLVTLDTHQRPVGGLAFNPVADNVLATSSNDYLVKLWDVETGQEKLNLDQHSAIIQSMSWNYAGNSLATYSKDKKIRIFDPRSGSVLEANGHVGPKGARVTFLGDLSLLASVGFGRGSERQLWVWDPRALKEPLAKKSMDHASGLMMPFYDNDTSILYLAGKGDGNIRYFEMEGSDPYLHFISQFQSTEPQQGMCMLPKLALDTASCEITRLLKLTKNCVQPISFVVPRKSSHFQDDIYPMTAAPKAALNSSEWFGGKSVDGPLKVSVKNPGDTPLAPKESKVSVTQTNASRAAGGGDAMTLKQLREENSQLTKRIAELEAELTQKVTRSEQSYKLFSHVLELAHR